MSSKMVKATLNGKFDIILPKHRADRPEWYTEVGWEKARLEAMHEHVKTGDIVYYVGAEEGEMSALCSIWGADVVLFEPNPKVWPNIRAIWEANKLKIPLGNYVGFASNTTEETPEHLDPNIDGVVKDGWPLCAYGEVIGDHGFRELYQESDAVPQVKIDDYVARTGIIPTVITFDCEGSDWQVVRGAEQTLRDHKPAIFASIHPEFMFHQLGEYSRDFRNWIIDLGYRETLLDWQHEGHFLYEPIS